MKQSYSQSDLYRQKVHDLIPGGAHTYSKGDDQFPQVAPAAIRRGRGCYVIDVDGNKFLDCSMGLTSVSLGHADPDVNQAIIDAIQDGVNFQRPSYLELEVAEKFLELVPGHEMIKFTKNGSGATTAAVKICRAFTGRKYVAFPSDHPFYSYDDWFIGKTACNFGVPQEIADLSLTFLGSDLSTLEDLFARYPGQIACVISEPERPIGTCPQYADKIIEICHSNGALFIQDEMVTGFKADLPGCIKHNKRVPDIATWGKGIANGYSFCALTGKKEVMDLGGIKHAGKEKLFLLSTTHGGETSGLAAVIATIKKFQENNVIAHNHRITKLLQVRVQISIEKAKLDSYIEVQQLPCMTSFSFKDKSGQPEAGYRTLFLQEMIARGVLFQGSFVSCFSHTEEDVDVFIQAFEGAAETYSKALEEGWHEYLVGSPAKPVFRKYI